MLCPSCNQLIPSESQFCPNCGHALAAPNSFTSPPRYRVTSEAQNRHVQFTPQNKSKSHSRSSLLIAAAILTIGMVIICVISGIIMLSPRKTIAIAPQPSLDINPVFTFAAETSLTNLTSTAFHAPTATITLSPTPYVSPTPVFTATPTPSPTITIDGKSEVVDFIYFYWQLINQKKFETAWLYQSSRFKTEVHQNNFNDFVNGFKYTKSVLVVWVGDVLVNADYAIVDADLKFTATNDKTINQSHRYELVKQSGQWLIDSAVKR